MRILLVNNLYPPYTRGGAERVVETIAREMHRQGHHVVVVTTVPSWAANIRAFTRGGWITETIDGIVVYRVASINLFPYWTIGEHNVLVRLFWHVLDMFAVETASIVRRVIKRERPDVVMTHNLKGLGFLIPRAIRQSGVRHIHTVHDVQLSVPSGLLFANTSLSFFVAVCVRWYERAVCWLIGSPDVVVSPSRWLQDFYEERGFFPQSKKVVLANPVPVIQWAPLHAMVPIVVMRFLYVGQLEKHKGILFLIETFKNLQPTTYNLQPRLDIVGGGSLLKKIQNEAQNNPRIRVHGAVPHEKLSAFYVNADALIVPSLVHENAPTVIFEAFAHGLPVIASRVGGIPEFVREGETGLLFDAGNTEGLLAVIQKISDDKNVLVQMGERAQQALGLPTPTSYVADLLGGLTE